MRRRVTRRFTWMQCVRLRVILNYGWDDRRIIKKLKLTVGGEPGHLSIDALDYLGQFYRGGVILGD